MPTICSSCGRTSGKCESCRKVDAILTPERIETVLRECAGYRYRPGTEISEVFARAISREVVAILARVDDEPFAFYDPHSVNVNEGLSWTPSKAYSRPLYARPQPVSTPAASGIGESGGE